MGQRDRVPDLRREMDFFASQHLTNKRPLKFDDLVCLRIFDNKGEVSIEGSSREQTAVRIMIRKNNGFFQIFQNGEHISTVRDEVTVNKRAYLVYKVIDEDHFELIDQCKMPTDETVIEEERNIVYLTVSNYGL